MGLFGNVFDFNGDGKMDWFEKSLEVATLMHLMDSDTEEKSTSSEADTEDKIDELMSVGLDPEELDLMDYDERRETIEDAGLDPDDYDC